MSEFFFVKHNIIIEAGQTKLHRILLPIQYQLELELQIFDGVVQHGEVCCEEWILFFQEGTLLVQTGLGDDPHHALTGSHRLAFYR